MAELVGNPAFAENREPEENIPELPRDGPSDPRLPNMD